MTISRPGIASRGVSNVPSLQDPLPRVVDAAIVVEVRRATKKNSGSGRKIPMSPPQCPTINYSV